MTEMSPVQRLLQQKAPNTTSPEEGGLAYAYQKYRELAEVAATATHPELIRKLKLDAAYAVEDAKKWRSMLQESLDKLEKPAEIAKVGTEIQGMEDLINKHEQLLAKLTPQPDMREEVKQVFQP